MGTAQTADYAVGRPAVELRGLVDSYVSYRVVGPPGVHRGLPSRHVTFVVALDERIAVTMPGETRRTAFTAMVGGLHQSPALITHDGVQHGVQLAVTPAGVRALFGVPAGELTGLAVPLDALLGTVAGELADRLAAAPGPAARFTVLDRVLSRALRAGGGTPDPAPEVGHAWRRLVASAGATPVAGLAAEVGWSRRHLAERFRQEIGLPPKVAARVLRFERVRAELLLPKPSLADVAARCGYADQAHLSREWRELAGCTPSRWLAEEAPWLHGAELPFVQDDEPLPAAG